MKNQIRYKYSFNPAISLFPVLVYSLLVCFLGHSLSLFIGMITSLIFISIDYVMKKNDSHPILLLSILISFIISYLYSLINHKYMDIIFEMLLLFQLIFLFINKNATLKILYNNKSIAFKTNKNIVFEFFSFIRRITIFVTIYLFVYIINSILIYYKIDIIPSFNNSIHYIAFLLYIYLFVHQYLRILIISDKNTENEWLPIVDSNMNVIGRIAKTLSIENKNQCLHPKVRILAFYKGRLLLKSVETEDLFSKDKYDTPYSKDIVYGEQITDTLKYLINKNGLKNERVSFVTRYLYETDAMRRVVFLFIVHIKDEKIISKKTPFKTKFWTESELANNIKKNILGDFIESEYEFINSIIYPAMKIMNDDGFDNNTWADSVGEDVIGNKPGI